jgi:predicted O-linked N-acetylglucosamine transferase (SPINDLY family)
MPHLTIQQTYELALLLHRARRLGEAEKLYLRIVAEQPEHADALHGLGVIAHQIGRNDIAVELLQRAIALKPAAAHFYNNLGTALADQRRLKEAIACYQKALTLEPDDAGIHSNLGNAFRDQEQGCLDEAVVCYQRALVLKPEYPEAHNNLGTAFTDQGRLDEAIASFRRALALKPDYPDAHSNLIYTLHFHPDCSAGAIAEECRRWNRLFAEPLQRLSLPYPNNRDPERKLRIGYVSPDFRSHPVGRFLLPLIEHHDRRSFELFAYAHVKHSDQMTGRFRSCMDVWRITTGLADEQLAEQIRGDGIDILIDLTMHMADSRLLVFARKPAPIQATWLAYCSTTGLGAMDYRLSDPYLDPVEEGCCAYSERTIRLAETYWCYQPTGEEPVVNLLPVLEKGFITFGSLNNFAKVTESTAAAWGRILQSVPQSRLVIHAHRGEHCRRFLQAMDRRGIEAQRIQFVGKRPMKEYFGLYHGIDIALDPAPYGGGTTTCDALWMGVPVVSLAGQTAVGRGGLSLLSNLGLPELVGRSAEQYVQIAVRLAGNPARLATLRATLRQRMLASALMDAPRFARNMEAAYRTMWRNWCGGFKG